MFFFFAFIACRSADISATDVYCDGDLGCMYATIDASDDVYKIFFNLLIFDIKIYSFIIFVRFEKYLYCDGHYGNKNDRFCH